MKTSFIERSARRLSGKRGVWLVVAVAVVLALPSLGGRMIADDHHFRMLARDVPGMPEISQSPLDAFNFTGMTPEDKAARKDRGLTAWWTHEDMQIAFWRPLSALTHWFDNALWGRHAGLMHFQNVLWYGLLVAAVAMLYRRFGMPLWIAALATLLYAVDEAHAIPVAWIANRNALLSGLLGVLCLAAHDAWRRQGWRLAGMAAPLLFGAGLLSAEAAVGTAGFLLAYAVFMDRGRHFHRAVSLLPYLCVGVIWRAAYNHLGYGVAATHLYIEPAQQPLTFLGNVLAYIPLMLSGRFAFPDPTVWLILGTPARLALLLWALLVIGAVFWLLWPRLTRERELRFWLAGTLMALLPACATWPQNRLTILAGVGAMALLAHAIAAGVQKRGDAPEPPSRAWRARKPLAVALFAVNVVIGAFVFAMFAGAIGFPAAYMAAADAHLPDERTLEETNLVIVSAPMDAFGVSIPIRQSSKAMPVPRSVLQLRGGFGPATLFRVDSYTVIVTTLDGLIEIPWSMLFRNIETHPFAVGETVRLPNVEITVLSVSAEGNPIETQFRFDEPLEQAGVWRLWAAKGLSAFTPPEVGASVQIPKTRLTDLVFAVLGTRLDFLR